MIRENNSSETFKYDGRAEEAKKAIFIPKNNEHNLNNVSAERYKQYTKIKLKVCPSLFQSPCTLVTDSKQRNQRMQSLIIGRFSPHVAPVHYCHAEQLSIKGPCNTFSCNERMASLKKLIASRIYCNKIFRIRQVQAKSQGFAACSKHFISPLVPVSMLRAMQGGR